MWCNLDNISVYYEMVGEGRPVLFLHGWTLDHQYEAADFEPIFQNRPGWQRVYIDLPGMGQTASHIGITNQDQILSVLLGFIARVLSGWRFVVVGSSAGAYLARGLVYHKMDSLDGLLLRAPMIVADDAKRTVPTPHPLIADPTLMATLDPEEAELLGEVLVQRSNYIDALRQKLHTTILPVMQRADSASLEPIRNNPANYGFSFDVDALSEPFQAPTLIITGRQDEVVGYRDAWSIVENYPRATFAVLDRADHLLPIEQRELFHALVHDWLDRVEEYATAAAKP